MMYALPVQDLIGWQRSLNKFRQIAQQFPQGQQGIKMMLDGLRMVYERNCDDTPEPNVVRRGHKA